MTAHTPPVRRLDDVLARFERSFPPGDDAKRHFHGVYYRNTLAVKGDLEAGGFLDPEWVEPWDVVFAELYLDALDRWNSGAEPSGPWQVAFAAAADSAISPLVHVLIGLNAHLNFDLPQALLACITDEQLMDPQLISRRQADFDHIDDIVVRRVREEDFELRKAERPGDRTYVDRLMTPLNRSASKRFLKEARFKVWRNAMELGAARQLGPGAYAGRLRQLEETCRAKVEDLVRPGKVLVRLGVTGFGVLLPPPTAAALGNPSGWPEELLDVFSRYLTCHYATVSKAGHPVTYPLTPYVGEDGRTLDVSCGLTSPAKAERARRHPPVCMLYTDATGSQLDAPPVVLVYGHAAVRDRELQRNTDRYVRRSLAKLPAPWRGVPRTLMRSLDWYWSRIWVQVTPQRIVWWPDGDLDQPPHTWSAPPDLVFAPSDPAPLGPALPAWRDPVPNPFERARRAARRMGAPVLTVVDGEGYPVPIPTTSCRLSGDTFHLRLPAGAPVEPIGPACLTFQRHTPDFNDYENAVFVGHSAVRDSGEIAFRIERALPDISLTGSRARRIRDFASSRRKLKGRARAEAARRGQRPPAVEIPRHW
jgi:hypothetical protein